MKKYNVIVTQHNDEEYVFSYNIKPSPIVELWEEATLSAIGDNKKLKYFSHIGCNDTLQDTLDKINYYTDKINAEGLITVEEVPRNIDNLTQEYLNYLHDIFHRYTDETGKLGVENETRKFLLIVNDLIHELEPMLRSNRAGNIVKLQFENDNIYEQYFSADLYPYFTDSWGVLGDLRLGYATLGKTLHACYTDNDISVIKEKMVAPQTYIRSEVYLIFFPHTEEHDRTIEIEKYHKWCIDNDTYSYGYDPEDPQHKYSGRPLLGKLDMEVMAKQFADTNFVQNVWCGYKSIRIEIE